MPWMPSNLFGSLSVASSARGDLPAWACSCRIVELNLADGAEKLVPGRSLVFDGDSGPRHWHMAYRPQDPFAHGRMDKQKTRLRLGRELAAGPCGFGSDQHHNFWDFQSLPVNDDANHDDERGLRRALGGWIDETGAFRHNSVIAVIVLKLAAAHDEYTRGGIALGTNGRPFRDGFTSRRCIDVSRCRWLVRGWRRMPGPARASPPKGKSETRARGEGALEGGSSGVATFVGGGKETCEGKPRPGQSQSRACKHALRPNEQEANQGKAGAAGAVPPSQRPPPSTVVPPQCLSTVCLALPAPSKTAHLPTSFSRRSAKVQALCPNRALSCSASASSRFRMHAGMMRKPNRSRVWHPHRVFLSSACLQGAAAIAPSSISATSGHQGRSKSPGPQARQPTLGEAKSQSPSPTKVWPMARKGETLTLLEQASFHPDKDSLSRPNKRHQT